jgi:hypothetical protein
MLAIFAATLIASSIFQGVVSATANAFHNVPLVSNQLSTEAALNAN